MKFKPGQVFLCSINFGILKENEPVLLLDLKPKILKNNILFVSVLTTRGILNFEADSDSFGLMFMPL